MNNHYLKIIGKVCIPESLDVDTNIRLAMDGSITASNKSSNEELLPMLGKIINTLTDDRYDRKQVQELLYWLGGTLGKGYDNEEQFNTIKDNCKEWLGNPNCFRD